MNTQEIYLLGLIGLRALAEYDPSEYKRSTDMSKRELDRQIEFTLKRTESPEGQNLYNEMREMIDTTESPIELSSLLQQIYISSFRKAQYYALQYSKQQTTERSRDLPISSHELVYQPEQRIGRSGEDELIRLSVMLLLRRLPEYTYSFNQHLKHIEVDCVLEPQLTELPHILIQAKSQIVNQKQLATIAKQLKSVMSVYGKKTIGIIVMEYRPIELSLEMLGANLYLLFFDLRKNQFIGEDFDRLIEQISAS